MLFLKNYLRFKIAQVLKDEEMRSFALNLKCIKKCQFKHNSFVVFTSILKILVVKSFTFIMIEVKQE